MHQDGFEVSHLCDALGVHRNGYYQWSNASENIYQQQDQRLAPMVQDIFFQHRRRYGARRISMELKDRGESCCRAKARKIMAQTGLVAIQPKSFKPRTTESRHKLGYSPNLLLEGVEVEQINQVWVGDITYIPLPTTFAYLATLMDLYSRKIIGWSLDLNMEEPLVIAALRQAIKARQPTKGLIHHTDRGGQYAGKKYRKILARPGMLQSMSRAGDCYDNAFMESCFGTIKTELEMTTYDSFEKAFEEIREYINYYNILRRHSAIDYLSPTSFEATLNH
jgi:transposase InsO family protein